MLKIIERKQTRKHQGAMQSNFFPIDLIYDPQGFTEKLFARIPKKRKDPNVKGDLKVLLLALTARMMGRHKLTIPGFFSYVSQALKAKNKNLARLLALAAEACHERLIREDMQDVVSTIIENLISEHAPGEIITMGLNAVREICARMPQAIEKDNLAYLIDFKEFKNRSVSNAAKALLNLYRDINPELLPLKLRGRENKEQPLSADKGLGGRETGLELYEREKGKGILSEKILGDEDFREMKMMKMKDNAVNLFIVCIRIY